MPQKQGESWKAEIKCLVDGFLEAYLEERNLEKALEFVSDSAICVGTGTREVAGNKAELRALMTEEMEVHPLPMKYEAGKLVETKYSDGTVCVFCGMKIAAAQDRGGFELCARLTAACVREGNEWKIGSLHLSAPEAAQGEKEFFPLKYGRQFRQNPPETGEQEVLSTFLNLLPGGIFGRYLEDGFPLYVVNDTMLRMLDYTYAELAAATGERMLYAVHPEDQKRVRREIFEALEKGGEYEIQYRLSAKNGKTIWVRDQGKRILTEDGRPAVVSIMTDVSNGVLLQKQLKKEASQDPLTGILNRRAAVRQIEMSFGKEPEGTLFLLDIDNLKGVNDLYGHQSGDGLLILLASFLSGRVRKQDILARLGGDEFLIYFVGLSSLETAEKKAAAMQEAFEKIAREKFPDLKVTVSIGIRRRTGLEGFNSMYRRADEALYEAKRSGKNTFRVVRETGAGK